MKKNKSKSMKVAPKYIREAIEEYNKNHRFLNEQIDSNSTIELNGAVYKVINMTLEEFSKKYNAVDMNDIRWT